MYFVAGLVGFAAGFVVWFITSRWIVASLFWVEQRFPATVGSRGIKAGEVALCGFQVLACLALAFWIARLMIG